MKFGEKGKIPLVLSLFGVMFYSDTMLETDSAVFFPRKGRKIVHVGLPCGSTARLR